MVGNILYTKQNGVYFPIRYDSDEYGKERGRIEKKYVYLLKNKEVQS